MKIEDLVHCERCGAVWNPYAEGLDAGERYTCRVCELRHRVEALERGIDDRLPPPFDVPRGA